MEKVLLYIKNYFARTKEKGTFIIAEEGKIKLKGKYFKGQYILVKGSIMNDGVYIISEVLGNEYNVPGLSIEEFEGYVFGLAVPKDIINAYKKLLELEETRKGLGIYESEKFNDYTYTMAKGQDGQVKTAFDTIKPSLAPYRRIYETSLIKAVDILA